MLIEDEYMNSNEDCALGKKNSLHISLLHCLETKFPCQKDTIFVCNLMSLSGTR